MADQQIDLFPVSDEALFSSTFRLGQLLDELDAEEDAWDEAKAAHKRQVEALRTSIAEERVVITRARVQRERGLTSAEALAAMQAGVDRMASVESVTLSGGGDSITLTPETRQQLDAAIRKDAHAR